MTPTLETDNRTFLAPWLVLPEMHWEMMEKVRQPLPEDAAQSALLSCSGKFIEDLNYTLRGEVAIVNISGGLTLHANPWSYYYRWATYENLSLGLQQLLDQPKIKTIVLVFDSPGGTVFGLEELVDLMYQARSKKRLVAFAQGYCTSAAYWIASACETVVASKGAYLGSVGSRIQIVDWSAYDRRLGITYHNYVSKQAPYKNAAPGTAKGDQLIQNLVDNTGSKFVAGVARNRGVDEQTVLETFGKGWLLQSDKAVTVGMADFEASLEDVIQAAGGLKGTEPLILNSSKEVDMFNDEQIAEINSIVTEAIAANSKAINEMLEKLQTSQETMQQTLEALGNGTDNHSAESKAGEEESATADAETEERTADNAAAPQTPEEDYKAKYEAAQKELEVQKAEVERLKNLPYDPDYQKEHGANTSDVSPGY